MTCKCGEPLDQLGSGLVKAVLGGRARRGCGGKLLLSSCSFHHSVEARPGTCVFLSLHLQAYDDQGPVGSHRAGSVNLLALSGTWKVILDTQVGIPMAALFLQAYFHAKVRP